MSRVPPRLQALALWLALALLVVASVCVGATRLEVATIARGAAALLHLGAPLERNLQAIVELRIWRALCASGVGAALALSGGYIQGMFRNGLASPSLIGVSGGASLGAALAILIVGGYAPVVAFGDWSGLHALLIPALSFLGALGVTALVAAIASARGRVSVTTLLLVGIAVNMCVAGVFAAIQFLTLKDWEVSKAILAWTFGTLDDRSAPHVATVLGLLAVAACAIPFVARELDLLKGGEEDAEALGVDVGRVKRVCLFAAALSASAAVAVAGQIGFVGLVVPHLVRLTSGASYRTLLALSIPAGAVFLVGADLLQRVALGEGALQPGVMMSLVGGPFFLLLLVRSRREIAAW